MDSAAGVDEINNSSYQIIPVETHSSISGPEDCPEL